jgi:DNA-binding winged helix-turn-helix (wHTH) protein
MSSKSDCAQNWAFGAFELEGRTTELRRNGVAIRLQEQHSQLLLFLLQHAGQIVTREDLRRQLWPAGTFVDFDHSLNTAVMKLREALGDSTEKPLYIQTLPRKGTGLPQRKGGGVE